MPDPIALFKPVDGGAWHPTAWSVGPWSPDALHGGPTAALLARAAERAGAAEAGDVTWMGDAGVALSERRLWDEVGPLGRSLQSLLVDRRN